MWIDPSVAVVSMATVVEVKRRRKVVALVMSAPKMIMLVVSFLNTQFCSSEMKVVV